MKTLLQIDTSIHSGDGASSRLAARFAAQWKRDNPQGRVIVRDLAREAVPHLTAERFAAFATPAAKRTPEQQAVALYSDSLIEELRQADTIVIGLPLYNFGVPSTLKAYFDHIARSGITFRYTEKGPVGLLTGKKAILFATRGGLYAGTPRDTQTPYVRDFLAFLGIEDVEFVYAEGLAMGEAPRARALEAAHQAIETLAAATAPMAQAA